MMLPEGSRIAVTGGSGFVGTNLVERFRERGLPTLNLDIAQPMNPLHLSLWQQVDIRHRIDLEKALAAFSPTHLFHLAARTDLEGTNLEGYSANTQGVTNVIDAAAKQSSLQRVLFASSRLVCRIGYQPKSMSDYCPSTLYGESKMLGEKLVRSAKGLPYEWVIVRPTSLWGPWFRIPYRAFFNTIARGLYVHPAGHAVRKSFGFVGNSTHQLEVLMSCGGDRVHGSTLYLADYEPIQLPDFAVKIQRRMKARPIRTVPSPLLRALAYLGDLLKRGGWTNVPLTTFRLDNLLTEMVHDLSALQDIVGPLPYTLDEGIEETVAWLREHPAS